MTVETNLIRALSGNTFIQNMAADLYCRSYIPWDDRFANIAESLMENWGLECVEGEARTVIAYPHGTRRKRPAFLALHCGQVSHFDAFHRAVSSTFTLEFVEAGKHGVAGESEDPAVRAAEKG